jgi:hypothetical protein
MIKIVSSRSSKFSLTSLSILHAYKATVADQNKDDLRGQRKTQRNWVEEIGWRMPRIEVAGEICFRRPRPTQSCRADDDDDDKTTVKL